MTPLTESMSAELSQLPPHVPVSWLVVLLPLLGLLIWHYSQHQAWQRSLPHPHPPIIREMWRALKWRSWQTMGVWSIAVGILVYSDMQRHEIKEFSSIPTLPAVSIVERLPSLPPASPPARQAPDRGEAVQLAAIAPAAGAEIEETLDVLKQQYEDVFVTYFHLLECKLAKEGEATVIYDAVRHRLQALGVHPDYAGNIYTAALGSYDALYSDAPCNPAQLSDLTDRYHRMLRQFSSR